jgi:drug/metabolite transporter (DMT)-like permease
MKMTSVMAGVAAVMIWSLIPAFVKIGSHGDDLAFLLVGRFLIASMMFLGSIKEIINSFSKIPTINWVLLSFILGANYYFQGRAMEALPASWYLIIFALNPIIALFLMKSTWTTRLILGLTMSIAGTLLFVNSFDLGPKVNPAIFIFMFLGMLTWVLYTVQIRNFQRVYSDVQITALTQFVSLGAVSLIWMLQGFHVSTFSNNEVLSVLALGITTPIAYYLFSYCLRHTPVFGVVSQYLEPVFGIIVGTCFFGETLTAQSLIGAAVIVTGALQVEKG